MQLLAAFEPAGKTEIEVVKDGKTEKVEVIFETLPTAAPDDLPAAESAPAGKPNLGGVDVGDFEVKIPEEASKCPAYAPADYDPRVSHGLVVILGPPNVDGKKQLERWKPTADQSRLVLLAPRPANPRGWTPPDAEFVIKTIEAVSQTHAIDPLRIVIYGETSGAAVGHLVIGKRRDLVHGLVSLNGAFPRGAAPPENEPLQRLAFYSLIVENSPAKAGAEATVKLLQDRKFPVLSAPSAETLSDDQLESIGRWVDSLDRL